MGVIYKDGILYGNNTKIIELTQAEFDALTPAQKADTTKMYFVTDASSSGGAQIDDTTTALDKVWSSQKVSDELDGISPEWGNITGTLSNQTDLQTALDVKISSTEKGANNGIATLNASGKVPESQLPSYVDDVIEGYYNTIDHKFYEESTYTTEIVGEQGKIYVSLDTDTCYRWSGSAFIEITSGGTWGSIVGTLSDQTDLQAALDEKTTEEVTENLIRDTVGWTGKNLLPNNANSQTINGVTFTVNADGSITANGTASADISFNVYDHAEKILQADVKYILSGCPKSGSSSTYYFGIRYLSYDYGDGTEGEFTSAQLSGAIWVTIFIKSGTTVSNLIFKPMLRKADISDPTYEPYHESVKQVLRDGEVIEGKNLLHIDDSVVTQTINGVTFTVNRNENGEVTDIDVNGTASFEATFWIHPFDNSQSCPYNGCLLSGCLNGDNTKYLLRVTDITTQSSSCFSGDTVINVTDTGEWGVCIIVRNGVTVNHVKFYPMVRYASESDPTFEPYYIPLKDSKFDRAEQRVLGAKNLLPYPYVESSKTLNGITYTINADGSILVNGTSTAESSINLRYRLLVNTDLYPMVLKQGAYIISKGTENTDVRFRAVKTVNNTMSEIITITAQEGTFTLDSEYQIGCQIIIPNGKTISNVTVYPMLRLASDTDNTYVPYAMTNKELTDKKLDKNATKDGWVYTTENFTKVIDNSTVTLGVLHISQNVDLHLLEIQFIGSATSIPAGSHTKSLNSILAEKVPHEVSVAFRGDNNSMALTTGGTLSINIATAGTWKTGCIFTRTIPK